MSPSGASDPGLGPLTALLRAPARSAVITDFDGTLADIVPDPESAVPLPGANDVLAALAGRFALVAVVSGRPLSFLAHHLAGAGPEVALYGGYGIEWMSGGTAHRAPGLERWSEDLAELLDQARAGGPPGIGIEPKGWAVTLHWRRHPETQSWALAFARRWEQAGMHLQPGRLAVEIRPPLGIDKGTVVEGLAATSDAVCFVGDDAGDLTAFDALDRLAVRGVTAVRVAVADDESPPEMAARADLVVHSPGQALALLRRLAQAAG